MKLKGNAQAYNPQHYWNRLGKMAQMKERTWEETEEQQLWES
jgi:hypothetical protein